jgi:hypothetical protein
MAKERGGRIMHLTAGQQHKQSKFCNNPLEITSLEPPPPPYESATTTTV